jgi:hypothetical protein
VVHGGDNFAMTVAFGELFDDFADPRKRDRIFCGPHRQRLSHRRSPLYFAFYSLR